MSAATNPSPTGPGGVVRGSHPAQDSMAEETICLLWRCRGCGAARLGTLEEKPERCPSCGGSDLEFVAED